MLPKQSTVDLTPSDVYLAHESVSVGKTFHPFFIAPGNLILGIVLRKK